jgi:uncharacterized protein with HEPN domain
VNLLVEDIWDALIKIDRYVVGMTGETFAADDKTVDAVARNFEIIGEAAARLPEDFRSQRNPINSCFLNRSGYQNGSMDCWAGAAITKSI